MKKRNLLFILFLFSNFVFGQNPLVKQWDKRFGGTDREELTYLQQTNDGGFILGGYSRSNISGDKSQAVLGDVDYWVIKIDSLGNKQWDKDFGGTDFDWLISLQQTIDGGFILGGYSVSDSSGDKTQNSWHNVNNNNLPTADYWIIKIDSFGNKQWDRTYGGTDNDYISSIHQTFDGGYILGGYSHSDSSGNKTQPNWDTTLNSTDYWIVKIDSLGNKQWDKNFGGTEYDLLYSTQQTSDKGYILGGTSGSFISGDKTQGSWGPSDYWIVKTDSLGNKEWDKDFGGYSLDYLYSLFLTADGGYILGGSSLSDSGGTKTQNLWHSLNGLPSYDYWMIKIDSFGIQQWDKDFGGRDDEFHFGNISQTSDGGYLLAGSSNSPISGDKTENNLGQYQTWVVKTDAFGIKQWDKTLHTNSHDYTGFAIQTKDHCYVMANYTYGGIAGDKTQSNWDPTGFSSDYWIIKFCDTTSTTSINPISNFQFPISISPNPFTSDITIIIQKQYISKASFTIKNVLGQTVYSNQPETLNLKPQTLNLSFLSKGIYLLEATIDPEKNGTGGERIVKKIVKE